MPKSPKKKIRIYAEDQCSRILKAAKEYVEESNSETAVKWDLLILLALTTGMRRGELLNCTWGDIDFGSQTIEVSPKDDTIETWKWLIKDTDSRTLPLIDEVIQLLIDYQGKQPEGYPYIFVPVKRYDYIQKELRAKGKWTLNDSRLKVVNNFSRQFGLILKRAHVKNGTFHDLRRTALSNWFANGLSEHDVMVLAGHSSFQTTHNFYLAVADDLVDRARKATAQGLSKKVVHFGARGNFPKNKKGQAATTTCPKKT